MHYVDTSVLMAYLVPETYSAQAEAALRNPAHAPLAVSAWTETELVSAFGILNRCRFSAKQQLQYTELKGFSVNQKPKSVIETVYQMPNETDR